MRNVGICLIAVGTYFITGINNIKLNTRTSVKIMYRKRHLSISITLISAANLPRQILLVNLLQFAAVRLISRIYHCCPSFRSHMQPTDMPYSERYLICHLALTGLLCEYPTINHAFLRYPVSGSNKL